MNKFVLAFVLSVVLSALPAIAAPVSPPAGVALPAPAAPVSLDASVAGVEFIGPGTMIMHNVLIESEYCAVMFQWSWPRSVWIPIDYSPEEPTFNTAEYYPLNVGDSWTYVTSNGGSVVLTITDTEEICGQQCVRLTSSSGGASYWYSDETGVWMTRYVNPTTDYTDFCPPMKLTPPQLYIGLQSLHPFYDAGYFYPPDIPWGSIDGWSNFIVKGIEDITVPAGTFPDCVRATFIFSYTEPVQGQYAVRTEESWFAKDVGIVKRIASEVYCQGGYIFHSEIQSIELVSSSRLP
jgi:hypothetical protein